MASRETRDTGIAPLLKQMKKFTSLLDERNDWFGTEVFGRTVVQLALISGGGTGLLHVRKVRMLPRLEIRVHREIGRR